MLGDDRGFAGRFWNGDIAEVIVFDTALTNSQRLSLFQYMYDKYAPPVNLGPDIAMQQICDTLLDASDRFIKYKWNGSNADTNSVLNIRKSGKYYVETTDIFGHRREEEG